MIGLHCLRAVIMRSRVLPFVGRFSGVQAPKVKRKPLFLGESFCCKLADPDFGGEHSEPWQTLATGWLLLRGSNDVLDERFRVSEYPPDVKVLSAKLDTLPSSTMKPALVTICASLRMATGGDTVAESRQRDAVRAALRAYARALCEANLTACADEVTGLADKTDWWD